MLLKELSSKHKLKSQHYKWSNAEVQGLLYIYIKSMHNIYISMHVQTHIPELWPCIQQRR